MGIAEELLNISSVNPCYSNVAMSIQDIIEHNKKLHVTAHMMKIEGFTKLYMNQVKIVESSVFEVFGIKWKLKLYPSGKSYPQDHVSLYLDMEDGDKRADVSLTLFALHLFDQTLWFPDCLNVCFNSCKTTFGIESLLPFTWLSRATNGLVRSDTAVFGVEIQRNQYTITRSIGTADCVRVVKPEDNKFTWKITKFSSFDQTEHYSHAFTVGERKWRIKIFPKGMNDQNGNGGLCVFLVPFEYVNNALKATNYAKYKLRVLDQRFGEHRVTSTEDWFSPTCPGYGYRDFITRSELNDNSKGFLMYDTIYIGVEFEFIIYTLPY